MSSTILAIGLFISSFVAATKPAEMSCAPISNDQRQHLAAAPHAAPGKTDTAVTHYRSSSSTAVLQDSRAPRCARPRICEFETSLTGISGAICSVTPRPGSGVELCTAHRSRLSLQILFCTWQA